VLPQEEADAGSISICLPGSRVRLTVSKKAERLLNPLLIAAQRAGQRDSSSGSEAVHHIQIHLFTTGRQ
jgi:hypothetical protein